ncbi:MAG: hypothetical protein WBB28_28985 [Crinalium sp.]
MNQDNIKPLESNERGKILIKVAKTLSEINQCKTLISEIYYQQYGITFSDFISDPEAKIESYPQYYLMALSCEILVGTVGLYTAGTNVEKYGNLTEEDIREVLIQAKASDRFSGKVRELTKWVVKKEWRSKKIAEVLLSAALSQDFLHINEKEPHVIVASGSSSIFNFAKTFNVRIRKIKLMPLYKVHENYRSHEHHLEICLCIPDIDIPKEIYLAKLPFEYISAKLNS